ncbi:MAG: MarR family winged helix-turn-helix transcriptional regulator [Firmicutes bacterium]|nr:MarR family winged helix-turn-helix transcriptional regulator [Bacillota bacterium]
MDYKELAKELLNCMPPPGRARFKRESGELKSEIIMLMHIKRCGEVLPKEISGVMGVSTARVATALSELEENGYVTREIDCNDRRRIIVKLTSKGEGILQDHTDKVLDKIAAFLIELGEHDAKEYVRIMGRIAQINRNKHD